MGVSMKKLSWPTVVVLCVAIVALCASAVALVGFGADRELIASVLGGESVIGMVALGMMRALRAEGDDHE
jgi:hypothetical protein